VWGVHEGELLHCLLHKLLLYYDVNERLYCESLSDPARLVDPALVTVQQQHCYPEEYFQDVPAAGMLVEGYPVRLRPNTTDMLVMQQISHRAPRSASMKTAASTNFRM
jgi:hypothetical protein